MKSASGMGAYRASGAAWIRYMLSATAALKGLINPSLVFLAPNKYHLVI
jgi:hypothetical protein